MAHFRGIPSALRDRFGIPVVFYDGDAPMSLPEFGGMDTGFNWYHDADPSEYDLLLSNSEGALDRLRALGAKRAEAVFWGADPEFFAPIRSTRSSTSSSTATATSSAGTGSRRWSESRRGGCPTSTSLSAGATSRATRARRLIGDVPFNTFSRVISSARVNLCITRRSHASVYASSSCRPFELASSGAAIVSNPYEGIGVEMVEEGQEGRGFFHDRVRVRGTRLRVDRSRDQRALRRPPTIDRGLGDAGAFGNDVDGECGVTVLVEQVARGAKNLLIGTFATRTAASAFLVHVGII